jgi:hypothetical protein
MNVYALADRLGKYAWEVLEEMPPDEFCNWMAYFAIERKREKPRK